MSFGLSALVIFVGTMWPFVAEMVFDRIVSVGPPFFDAAFTPSSSRLAVILPVGPCWPGSAGRYGPLCGRSSRR